jgi:hypothetical protein
MPTNAPNGTSPAVRAGTDAVALLEREIAFLVAYATSYGRYKGAAEAHDSVAATRQAAAMVSLIDSAIANGSRAASREEEAQHLLLVALDNAGRPGGKTRSPGAASIDAVSPELRDELIAGGMTRGEVNQLERALRANPGLAARERAALRGRLAVDSSMRKGLSPNDPTRGWPPPDEMPGLIAAAATARQIRSAPMYLFAANPRKPTRSRSRASARR